MWKVLTYKLQSDSPMLMHSGQTADPLNKWAKMLKEISGKRNKTDADYEQMAKIEFFAGLYMGENGPVIPAPNIDAMLIGAAKKLREGPVAKSGVFCVQSAPLQYVGPRNADDLWADERFRHVAIVRVQTSRIARTRPIFNEWTATVAVQYEDSIVNAAQVDRWMQIAGSQCGLGDWRPQYGRFSVERVTKQA